MKMWVAFGLIGIIICALPVVFKTVAARKGVKISAFHMAAAYMFIISVFLIFEITGVPSVREGFLWMSEKGTKLLPFSGMATEEIMIYYLTGNLLMFIPIGFLVPCISGKFKGLYEAVLIGAGMSLIIEMSQLFSVRTSDIDDFVMNTCGTLIGCGIFYLLNKNPAVSKITDCAVLPEKGVSILKWEPLLYTAVVYLGISIIFPY